MFKLVLQTGSHKKIIECDSIEESRIAYTEALAETFIAVKGGIVYNCYWQTWKLYRDNQINPLTGQFSFKEDTVQVLSYCEFVQVVSDSGHGLWRNDENGKDIISFGCTGDKCFASCMSQNFNQYVTWDVAYQMYVDFLRKVEECTVS